MKKILYLLAVAVLVALPGCKKVNLDKGIVFVERIDISQTEASVVRGETLQLDASVFPSNATYKEISWSSSNTYVAEVDGWGGVTAKALGTTTITAEGRGGVTATCEVTVVTEPVPVTGLSIVPEEVSVSVGGEVQLQLVFTPSNTTSRSVNWFIDKNDDKEVASISSNHVVTGKKKGSVTFFAVSKDNSAVYASVDVHVVDPFTSLSIPDPANMLKDKSGTLILVVDDEVQLTGEGSPAGTGDMLSWTVSEGNRYATVTPGGLLKCTKAGGTVTVKAFSMADPTVFNTIKFKTYSPVSDLQLVPDCDWSGKIRPTEYIGFGATQKWRILILPDTACQDLTVSNSGFDSGNANFSWDSFSSSNNVLTVVAPSTGSRISTKDTKYSGSTTLSCYNGVKKGYFKKDFPFYVSLYDPFSPKPGDALYLAGTSYDSKLVNVDGGYRGNGIFDKRVGKSPSGGIHYANLGYVGEKHIEDDPDYSPDAKHGIYGMATDNNTVIRYPSLVHGVGLAPVQYVIRDPNVVVKYGDEAVWPLGRLFVSAPYFDAEMWSYDKDDVAPSDALIRNPSASSYTQYKMTAFHNTKYLAGYNEGRGSSHAVKPAIYTGFTSTAKDNYLRFYYGRKSSNINDYVVVAGCSSPWLLPTIADMMMMFHGSLFNGSTAEDDAAADRIRILSLYRETWLSHEGAKILGCYFSVEGNNKLFWAYPNKNEYHRIIPIVYF